MKKLGIVAVLFVAGAAIAVSGLFAQELKFNGYVNAGLGVVASGEEDAPDPFFAAAGVDSSNDSFRIRLDAAYANGAGNAGAALRLQASGGYNFISFPVAYGWFSAFNAILTAKGGIVDDDTWESGGEFFTGDAGEGLGALVKATPIPGLDIGVGAYLVEIPSESAGNSWISEDNRSKVSVWDSTTNKKIEIDNPERNEHNPAGSDGIYSARDLEDVKYTFNAAYTHDLFRITASYRPKSVAGAGGAYLASMAHAAVSLKAVPNLTAIVEVELDNLQDFKALKAEGRDRYKRRIPADDDAWGNPVTDAVAASGKISFGETFEYTLGDLTAGLWAVEWISQAEGSDFAVYANPWASYALGAIVPRLDLGFGSGAQVDFNRSNLNWHRTNVSPLYDSDVTVISIRPSVKLNIDPNTFVEIGDLIDFDGGPDQAWGDKSSRITNVFYVDFKWSF
jgi:hypothetical protein